MHTGRATRCPWSGSSVGKAPTMNVLWALLERKSTAGEQRSKHTKHLLQSGLTGKIVRVVVRVEAILNVVVHSVAGPHSALVPI